MVCDSVVTYGGLWLTSLPAPVVFRCTNGTCESKGTVAGCSACPFDAQEHDDSDRRRLVAGDTACLFLTLITLSATSVHLSPKQFQQQSSF